MRLKSQLELALELGEAGKTRCLDVRGTETGTASSEIESPTIFGPTMERVVSCSNLRRALKQVQRNKGSLGQDGMTVEDLVSHLREHWPTIRDQLLVGTYEPQPVLCIEIPAATYRLVRQAVMQVLQANWDPTVGDASYGFGFRPKRSAHRAISKTQD